MMEKQEGKRGLRASYQSFERRSLKKISMELRRRIKMVVSPPLADSWKMSEKGLKSLFL